jgi:hypothetical protein
MTSTFEQFREEISSLKLDDSLLFLNHLLAVAREDSTDPPLKHNLDGLKYPLPAFIVHSIAKWILLEASNLGVYTLDWARFERLKNLWIALPDPIQNDPSWPTADPTGFFERLFAQQLPAQRQIQLRDIGLALALFRDAGTPVYAEEYHLRSELEAELGLPIETFMKMGHLCLAIRRATLHSHPIPATFTHMDFVQAWKEGLTWCDQNVWEPFLRRVACTPQQFQEYRNCSEYRVTDVQFIAFEFNPLFRFPLIEIHTGKFLAVDPRLLISRVTWGLFYDLFERDRTNFSERFGDVFAKLIGNMLSSVCPSHSLWSDSEWTGRACQDDPRLKKKRGDWIYKGRDAVVLIECKSLRPSLPLTQYGKVEDVQNLVGRVAAALRQVMEQANAIQQGKWTDEGLPTFQTACVLLTYGRFNTVNLPFFRRRVRQKLSEQGLPEQPFVILALEEFDMVIRLVDQGEPLDKVLLELAKVEDSGEVLQRYGTQLAQDCVSMFTRRIGRTFLDSLTSETE